MSQPNNQVRQGKSMDIYTVMLVASFIALLIGFCCMSYEYSRYESWLSWKTDDGIIKTSYDSNSNMTLPVQSKTWNV